MRVLYSSKQFEEAVKYVCTTNPLYKNKPQVVTEALMFSMKELCKSNIKWISTLGFVLIREEEQEHSCFIHISVDPAFPFVRDSLVEQDIPVSNVFN